MGRSSPGKPRSALGGAGVIDRPDPVRFSHRADPAPYIADNEDEIIDRIGKFFRDYDINAEVIQVKRGPSATQYFLELGPGEKIERLTRREDDLRHVLNEESAGIGDAGGRISIDIPEKQMSEVTLLDLMEHPRVAGAHRDLPFLLLGRTADGTPATVDMVKTPHMLVAGVTGSGKSVALEAIIQQLVLRYTPSELQLTLIDLKGTEFNVWEDLPHLDPEQVIYDPELAAETLEKIEEERGERAKVLQEARCKDVTAYLAAQRSRGEEPHLPFPIRVVIIDEFGKFANDLAGKDEKKGSAAQPRAFRTLESLASLGRATEVHLILSTQRPRKEIMPTWIQNNIGVRLAFRCESSLDSIMILGDQRTEAADLQRGGDAYLQLDGDLVRLRGTYVQPEERDRLVTWWKRQPRH